ncbi:MAG: excinuclease ABC subunit C [Candidatus Eisenbacteria bacterium RBG_16_71_46]|nr:MAG: excinuclease ABC subunit C [Candidatus Eisenbacteria bacterium RBG_16_71_46]
MSALSEKVLNLPPSPGVYLFKDPLGRVLYVGKAKSLSHRVRSYLTGDNGHLRLAGLMAQAADLDTILTDTEAESLLLEATLIRQHKPHFNTLLKDDKSFPYVRISVQEDFPRLSVTRQVREDGARYLGPYTDVKNLRRTLREIRRIFPVRTCRNFEDYRRADRPCLYFHIKRCAGPCYSRARVDRDEYRALVDGLLLFLSGRDQELLVRLRAEMEEASTGLRYEAAARRRDQIALLETARVPQKVVGGGGGDRDILGVARHGRRAAVALLLLREGRVVGKESRILDHLDTLDEARVLQAFVGQHYLGGAPIPRRLIAGLEPADAEALLEALGERAGRRVELTVPARGRERRLVASAERNAALALEDLEARAAGRRARFSPEVLELQKALDLPVPPHRLVCFDISNLGAEGAVAAVVASENGQARKSLYRRMRIRHPGPDDVAMIAEAVERYWARVESGELPRPDLVVVDGGAGQVAAARAALDGVSTRPVSLIGLAKREETVVRERAAPLHLPRRSGALRAIQRLRDEAHRFGLAYHRVLRGRVRIASALDQVPGVGPARRAALLRAFGSASSLRAAGPEEIASRAHVPLALARRIAERLGAAPTPGTAGATVVAERKRA